MNNQTIKSIDDYIASFPDEIQKTLQEFRATIQAAAPGAEERISYSMPAYVLNGNLVYFAAHKKHIGLYHASSAIPVFEHEASRYAGPKGSLKFPLDEPIPLDLVGKIVKFRVAENLQSTA